MSRTDKTNPYWLKIKRDELYGEPLEIWHYCHRDKFRRAHMPGCTPEPGLPATRRVSKWYCRIYVSAYGLRGRKIWGNRPDKATRKAIGFEGRNRMLLRQMKLAWKSAPLEDIDSTENAPRNKRHSHNRWLWD